jgi:transposase
MQAKKPKDNTATLYWHKIKDLEKEVRHEKKKRRGAEEKAKELEKRLKDAEDKLKEAEQEIDHLKDCKKSYVKMIFKKNKHLPLETEMDCLKKKRKTHRGVSRLKPAEELIQNEVDVTLSCCPGCNHQLTGCKRIYKRVIEDIAIQPQTKITKYWIHQYVCKKCGLNSSAKTQDIIGQTPFGRKVFATVLFYRYRMKTVIDKIKEALKDIHGLEISKGGIQNILYQASVQFGEKYEELIELIRKGAITHADETSWRVNGQNWWTWLWSNDDVVLYTTENTRGQGVPEEMLKTFKGLLNRDGCNSYNIVDTEQQICWTHMLRKAHEYSEREKATSQMILLKNTLKKCYRRIMKWHKQKHSKKERVIYHDRMKKMFIDLSRNKIWTEEDAETFIKAWLIRHKDRFVTFLKYSNASPDNNYAERCIRPMVVFRKITGGSRSKQGIKATDINMSIIETWVKQGLSIMKQMPIFGLEN